MVRVALLGACSGGTLSWSKGGAAFLTVIVKATYSIAEEGTMVPTDPLPVTLEESHFDGQPTRSLRLPSDVAPFKPAADILLMGHAYAPPNMRVATSVVRLSVNRGPQVLMNKTLEVSGDAVEGGHTGFDKMPIVFERAYGGAGIADNPIGVGAGDAQTPNVVYRERPNTVACYGPISEWWPVRRARLGETTRDEVACENPRVPSDFDWSYFHVAPEDQRTAFLEGNEQLILDGLHPDRQHSTHVLPEARGLAAVFDLDGPRALVTLDADTMLIEPDDNRVSVVWRGVIEVPADAELGNALVVAGVACKDVPVVLPSSRDDLEVEASDRSLERKSEPALFDRTVTVDAATEAASSDNGAPFELAPAGESSSPASPSSMPPSTPWAEATASEAPPHLEDFGATVDVEREVVAAQAPFSLAKPGELEEHDDTGTPWGEAMPSVPEPLGEESTLALRAVREEPVEAAPVETRPVEKQPVEEKPAVTEDGIPIRWATAEDEAPESTPARRAEKAPKVPELPRPKALKDKIYNSFKSKK